MGNFSGFSDLGEARFWNFSYVLRNCARDIFETLAFFTKRPLKQRLSKNDLAKIGYGSPGTVKASLSRRF